MSNTERDKLAKRLRREVSVPRLMGAVAMIIKVRRQRAGLDADNFDIPNLGELLEEFLRTSSVQQLKVLRQLAKNIKFDAVDRSTMTQQ